MARPQKTSAALQALTEKAVRHHQAGRLDEAERLYRQVLAVDPRHADSLHLLGLVSHQRGHMAEAVDLIARAIGLRGAVPVYHANLAVVLKAQGRAEAALAARQAVARLQPESAEAQLNLALAFGDLGRLAEAEAACRAALRLAPDNGAIHARLGDVLRIMGRCGEAAPAYQAALRLCPGDGETWSNLGVALATAGRPGEAVAAFETAVRLRPDLGEVHANLSLALAELGRAPEAVAAGAVAVRLRPEVAGFHLNLGVSLSMLRRLDEAIAAYRTALRLDPDCADAHYNLATALLAQGQMEAGLREFEWRWRMPQMRNACRRFPQPRWQGEAAPGRTLLVHAEQGYGDTLQFCRYGTLAAERGLRVVMQVQRPLLRLMRSLPGVDLLVANDEVPPAFDLECPMMSLPLAVGTTLETIPDRTPYLQADPAELAAWQARLHALAPEGRRVGVVWAGNPRAHLAAAAAVDRRRSMPMTMLAPLLEVPGVRFFSLQMPPVPEAPLIDLMGEVRDFADTAALIGALDLVITVDTAVVHLAGALGRPVWLLDRFDACWRWLIDRRDSPWYPTLRLYRQSQPGEWGSVMEAVARDLRAFAG
ncbi:Tetratricopeptide repeat protein [Rhodovastum atsumiense]|nr:tetratricopeptide repeat protein [Rhodovastum atsumiense]CAH2602747.1 Tetratricopeptide repeat protein [Rhodovastum atsumiense]